ncbi:MAG: FixH family protein [Sphingomonadaceae bacterium]|nr:FixH family protein [Sphingomonadaceae bacterium]
MAGAANKRRGFTGWHMTGLLVAFFGVVIGVNVTMASFATSTFGGVVVDNSYVASQKYNDWLEQAREQEALGWGAKTSWRPDGKVAVALLDVPSGATLQAIARHPLGREPDQELSFVSAGEGRFVSDQSLPDGRWTLRMVVTAAGKEWRQETIIP